VDTNDLPLLELFTKLREAGLPLGIDEYHSVLQALQAGFGISDKTALKRLCQSLWVKSAEEKRLFEYHFEKTITSGSVCLNTSKVKSAEEKRLFEYPFEKTITSGSVCLNTSNLPKVGDLQRHQHKAKRSTTSQIARYVFLWLFFILGILVALYAEISKNWHPTKVALPKPTTVTPDFYKTLIIGFLLLILVVIAGYVIFRLIIKLNTQRRTINNSSPPQQIKKRSASTGSSEMTPKVEDEIQVATSVRQAARRKAEITQKHFNDTNEYFPVTRRQMKQSWRYLRRLVREGVPTELDVEATVNQIGRQGLLLKPVLVPRRVNRTELLLLIDQDGSMVPFHALSNRLAETALRGGRLGEADIYYFHNCPIEYLYQDPNHQMAELIGDILDCLRSGSATVLIFSDAGAARGGFSRERIELTAAFLDKLKQRVRYIAWLNPMPRSRWLGTTSGEIARLVPMFEFSRRGLDRAIGVLRGQAKY
jgi:uncharacterized protein